MTKEEIQLIVDKQRDYFNRGETLDISKRKKYLVEFKKAILDNMADIYKALKKDLGKSEAESYMCEIGLVLSELGYTIKHIHKFTKKRRVKTPISQFHAKSYEVAVPYGNILVMSPWNYPILLSFDPIIEAVAAGNTVVLKTSEYSPYTNLVMKKIIEAVFPQEYVAVIFGGFEENTTLIHTKFDFIFFTGSKHVGKIVYQNASAQMIPCVLELGGKSPCIVDKTANIKLAAKRIVFGKFLNCGQTCVAPDYLICDKSIKDELIAHIKREIIAQFGQNPLENENYGKIITSKHYERVSGLIDYDKVIFGGRKNDFELRIEPTIMDNVKPTDKIMQEEIFGPILPIMTYESLDEAKNYVKEHDTPLACYIFSTDKATIDDIVRTVDFGGGCVNDTIIHLATSNMRFGGFKESGIGSYHGFAGFQTFSHYKSIVDKKNWIDMSIRYQPYNDKKLKMVKKVLK